MRKEVEEPSDTQPQVEVGQGTTRRNSSPIVFGIHGAIFPYCVEAYDGTALGAMRIVVYIFAGIAGIRLL